MIWTVWMQWWGRNIRILSLYNFKSNNVEYVKFLIPSVLIHLPYSSQPVFEPIVITSSMIEATDDDYDDDDPGPPDQYTEDIEDQDNFGQNQENNLNTIENERPNVIANSEKEENLTKESKGFSPLPSITQNEKIENFDPVVSLESISLSKSR